MFEPFLLSTRKRLQFDEEKKFKEHNCSFSCWNIVVSLRNTIDAFIAVLQSVNRQHNHNL